MRGCVALGTGGRLVTDIGRLEPGIRLLDTRSHCFSPSVIPEKRAAIAEENERRAQGERKNGMEEGEKKREREKTKKGNRINFSPLMTSTKRDAQFSSTQTQTRSFCSFLKERPGENGSVISTIDGRGVRRLAFRKG